MTSSDRNRHAFAIGLSCNSAFNDDLRQKGYTIRLDMCLKLSPRYRSRQWNHGIYLKSADAFRGYIW